MTTTDKTLPDFIYVKDLPDNGGLRAGRMKTLMGEVTQAQNNGLDRAIVFSNPDGSIRVKGYSFSSADYCAVARQPNHEERGNVREVYNLRIPLASQFAASRALNW